MLSVETWAPEWDLVRAFLALYRKGDYQAAAEHLGVNESTLRRKIHSLEKALGGAVFVRGGGSWTIAPGRQAMVDAALAVEESAARFFLAGADSGGMVRISMPYVIADALAAALSEFERAHPHIALSLSTEARFVDLERDGIDFAVRLARPARDMSNLKIRKLGDVELGVYASEDYLASRSGAAERAPHRIVAVATDFAHRGHDFAYGNVDWVDLGVHGDVVMACDDIGTCARMCSLGVGVALLPCLVAEGRPRLRRLPGGPAGLRTELWAVSRLDIRAPWQRELLQALSDAWRAVEAARCRLAVGQ